MLMPELDGPATLTSLRNNAATAAIPVVFMTAKTDRTKLAALEAMGACGVLRKPIDPIALPAQVRSLLERGSHPHRPAQHCRVPNRLGNLTQELVGASTA